MAQMKQAYAYSRYQAALRNGWDFLEGLEIPCQCGGNWTLAGKVHGHDRFCDLSVLREERSYYDLRNVVAYGSSG